MSTTWTNMSAMHFDTTLAPSPARARKIVAAIDSAEASLFPDLMPETGAEAGTGAGSRWTGKFPCSRFLLRRERRRVPSPAPDRY